MHPKNKLPQIQSGIRKERDLEVLGTSGLITTMWRDHQTSNSMLGCINRVGYIKWRRWWSHSRSLSKGHSRNTVYTDRHHICRQIETNLSVFWAECWQNSNLQKGVVFEPEIIYSLESLVVIKYLNGYHEKEKMSFILSITRGWNEEQWMETPGEEGFSHYWELELPEDGMYSLRTNEVHCH